MMSEKMCSVHKIAWALVFVGAINWGLVGLFNFDLVEAIFGGMPVVLKILYILVGLSGLGILTACNCKACKK